MKKKMLSANSINQMNHIFDLYFNNTNVGVAVIDIHNRVIQVNKAFEALYGWCSHEVVGEPLCTTPDFLTEQVDEFYREIVESGQASAFETYKLHKNENLFQASVTVSPLKEKGEIFALVEVTEDITQSKEAGEKLKESEERYRKLVELSPEPIIVYCDLAVVYVNQAAVKLVGAETKELLVGRSVLDFMHPDYIRGLETQVQLLMKAEAPSEVIEIKLVRLDKEIIDVEIRAVPIEYLGKPALQLLCRDVTHKKTMEKIMRERDEEYRRMLKLLPEPIVVHEEEIIIYINDVGVKLLGASDSSELIGRSILEFIHPDYRTAARRRMEDIVKADSCLNFIELKLIALDGQLIDIESSSIVVQTYLEKPIIQTVLRDITQRKNTEEMIRRSEKLSVVGQLAAGVAHEIRNPLTALKGFTQLMKRAPLSKIPEYADIMLTELDRIDYIVNEFMLIAKPHNRKFESRSILEIVENVISLLHPQALLHNVEMTLVNEIAFTSVVECDEHQLKQVFINLIKNAIEAMPSGGSMEVAVQYKDPETIRLRFIDHGVGIPEEVISKLGNPFFTTKEKGTGLGLMVCFRIIESHKGTMNIQSELGVGTTVEIELPYK